MSTAANIGYVGLGNMGGALARRLALSRRLRVFDLRPEAMEALADAGCAPSQSAAALGAECATVLTCLPTSEDVRQAVLGPGGLAEGMGRGGLIIDQTTGDPNATRAMAAELAERGLRLIDAPVSGGRAGAEAGTIAVMVGASDADYAEALALLQAIGPNIFHCGGVGAGHAMKLVNNVIAASALAASCEALVMGVKNGLEFGRAIDVLNKSSGRSFMSERVLSALADGPQSFGFALSLMLKDVRLATRLGAESGAPMFVAAAVRELHQAALVHLGPEADMTELLRTVARNAGARPLR